MMRWLRLICSEDTFSSNNQLIEEILLLYVDMYLKDIGLIYWYPILFVR